MIDENGTLWNYLSQDQRALVRQGYYLLEDVKTHVPRFPITDYSFIVFPFAKAYEGFLKQLFLDMGLIKKWQYESDHFRIGKALSPNLAKQLKKTSVYAQLVYQKNSLLADELWHVWKQGRNLIFHYFPHNYKAITLPEAERLISEMVAVMEKAVENVGVGKVND